MKSTSISRRSFIKQTSLLATGVNSLVQNGYGQPATSQTTVSYSRIIGANDRIHLGHVGIGSRGHGHQHIVASLKELKNAEMSAICDIWSVNREHGRAMVEKSHGRAPQTFKYLEDMLAMRDLDGVIISTPEHQHSPMLLLAAQAGKHAYVEKPMGNVLEEAKQARDAVLKNKLIVQVGTQRRSEPYQIAARELFQAGACGQVSKVEVEWNYRGPRWRGRPEVKQIREQDTDWPRWLMNKPARPFDPQLYFEYRLYREFSSGIPDQWMSHGIDLVHWFMDDHFPKSVVAHGGVFAWPDGRENPDTFHALLEYPRGFLVSYSTSFGNDAPSFMRFMGKKATLMNFGTEGTPRWKWVEEKGNYEGEPEVIREERWVSLPGDGGKGPPKTPDNDLSHMANWLDALRAGKQPSAPVTAGFAHSVACIMAARSQFEKKRLYWNPQSETIQDHPIS